MTMCRVQAVAPEGKGLKQADADPPPRLMGTTVGQPGASWLDSTAIVDLIERFRVGFRSHLQSGSSVVMLNEEA